jgi:hypothetical protein
MYDEIDDELRPNGKLWNYLGVYVYSICVDMYMHICIYHILYIYVHMYAHIYISTHKYMHVYIDTYTYIYTHIYPYM